MVAKVLSISVNLPKPGSRKFSQFQYILLMNIIEGSKTYLFWFCPAKVRDESDLCWVYFSERKKKKTIKTGMLWNLFPWVGKKEKNPSLPEHVFRKPTFDKSKADHFFVAVQQFDQLLKNKLQVSVNIFLECLNNIFIYLFYEFLMDGDLLLTTECSRIFTKKWESLFNHNKLFYNTVDKMYTKFLFIVEKIQNGGVRKLTPKCLPSATFRSLSLIKIKDRSFFLLQ